MAKENIAKSVKGSSRFSDVNRSSRSTGFIVEKRGSDVYVNGNKILMTEGRASVSRKKMRDAARKVAAGRK